MCSGTGRTELGMEIHRNSLGHRCYTAQDIQIFLGIRELKKKGLQPESDPRADAEAGAGNGGDQSVSGGSGETGKGEAGSGNTGKSGRSAGGGWSIFCPSGKQNSWRTL